MRLRVLLKKIPILKISIGLKYMTYMFIYPTVIFKKHVWFPGFCQGTDLVHSFGLHSTWCWRNTVKIHYGGKGGGGDAYASPF